MADLAEFKFAHTLSEQESIDVKMMVFDEVMEENTKLPGKAQKCERT